MLEEGRVSCLIVSVSTISSVVTTVSGITDVSNDWGSDDLLGDSVDGWGSVVDCGLESVF
jgi:hypothetical protein